MQGPQTLTSYVVLSAYAQNDLPEVSTSAMERERSGFPSQSGGYIQYLVG